MPKLPKVSSSLLPRLILLIAGCTLFIKSLLDGNLAGIYASLVFIIASEVIELVRSLRVRDSQKELKKLNKEVLKLTNKVEGLEIRNTFN